MPSSQPVLNKHLHPNVVERSDALRSCVFKGCLGRGYHEPVLALSFDGVHYVYMAWPGWLMCDYHKQQIGLEDLVDEPVFGKGGVPAFVLIQQSFRQAGKKLPQREWTKLIWRLS